MFQWLGNGSRTTYSLRICDSVSLVVSQLTKDFFVEIDWEKLLRLLYSLGIVPSDYHLFKGLQNHFDGLKMTSREEVEHSLVSCFASGPKEFYLCGLLTDGMRF